ncbi:MAG: family 10 glycosylhydrolase [Flavobacteriaceae bacterium]|nr:family 10 glycosylhydrolase [Flavobacteriaceae bacterium]
MVPAKISLPEIKREFRAAWIATVANLNWPSRNDLSSYEQQEEAIQILDALQNAKFNAVIFQARTASDALYNSSLEPWSYYLTGKLGQAPEPYYDPLEFWITEAHKRGMELHVWINPFRAHHTTGGKITSNSIAHKMSQHSYQLRNGMYWLDPSATEVQDWVSKVIQDILIRYDLDALHMDDYFYPYREYHGGRDFPDHKTWNDYLKQGGQLSRADWRRDNINKFVHRIHQEIKREKPHVKFGISPFGIWKPGFPAGTTGLSQYDELYADAKLWLNEGWLDYFSPQLYWKIGGAQDFNTLLQWWENENTMKRHLWPGLNTIGVKNVSNRTDEISQQIQATRRIIPQSTGVIHYSVNGITKNTQMLEMLTEMYKEEALIPATPWLKANLMKTPHLQLDNAGDYWHIDWQNSDMTGVRQWVIYLKYGTEWKSTLHDFETTNKLIPKSLIQNNKEHLLELVAIKAIDRNGNESEDLQLIKVGDTFLQAVEKPLQAKN